MRAPVRSIHTRVLFTDDEAPGCPVCTINVPSDDIVTNGRIPATRVIPLSRDTGAPLGFRLSRSKFIANICPSLPT